MLKKSIFKLIIFAILAGPFFQIKSEFSFKTKLGTAVSLGAISGLLSAVCTKNAANISEFPVTGKYRELLDNEIKACGLDPEKIKTRYDFTSGGVALNILDTVAIDPLMWKDFQDDPEAIKCKLSIEKNIFPKLQKHHHEICESINEILTPNVQRFVFRHELGHAARRSTKKAIPIVGVTVSLGTLVAMHLKDIFFQQAKKSKYPEFEAHLVSFYGGILGGMTCAMFIDMFKNFTFQHKEEVESDLFAARYSTKEEVLAAADFFEKLQDIFENKTKSWIAQLPTRLLTGHPNGRVRAKYLREFANNLDSN